MIYLCSPGNPSGAVVGMGSVQEIMELAEKYDFIIAADECYSEIYQNEQHPLLGLRSGFVAGDSELINSFLHY